MPPRSGHARGAGERQPRAPAVVQCLPWAEHMSFQAAGRCHRSAEAAVGRIAETVCGAYNSPLAEPAPTTARGGGAAARSRSGRARVPVPSRPPRGARAVAPREALGGRSLLARARARRRRGRPRGGADARRDRARLRALDVPGARRRREARRPRARGARLRRRHRRARDRDHRLPPARAVLRLLDDRLGEPDRDRPRGARASATGSEGGSPTGGRSRRCSAPSSSPRRCSSPRSRSSRSRSST